jgi:hypothetical protein
MLNYAVDPSLIAPFVSEGTTLDTWRGTAFVSLVGFLFADTRVLSIGIPWHRTFEEVNLRIYVRRVVGGEVRRGVTFIREIVPRAAIAFVARVAYNEPYRALPMRHAFGDIGSSGAPSSVAYEWRLSGRWAGLRAQPVGDGAPAAASSEEEFITEHYWGYTRQRDGSTVEYRVAHPRWNVWRVDAAEAHGDLAAMYGAELARALTAPPSSAFLADGSAITVSAPSRLPRD